MLHRLRWYSIPASAAAAAAGAGCMMLSWRTLLADLGSPLPLLVAMRVTFVSQLGKYVPGGIWSVAAQVELGHDYQVPRRRGVAAILMGLMLGIGTGLLISAVTLPLASPSAARHYVFFLAAVPLLAAALLPRVMHRLLNLGLRIIRQEPLERPVSWRGLGTALGWTVLGWLLLGLQAWLLLAEIVGDGPRMLLIALGAYVLSCTLALLVVVAPNGLGAREVVLVAALAPVLPASSALALALCARIATTFSDLAWGTCGLALKRHARISAGLAPRAAVLPGAGQYGPRRQAGRHRKPAGVRSIAIESTPAAVSLPDAVGQ